MARSDFPAGVANFCGLRVLRSICTIGVISTACLIQAPPSSQKCASSRCCLMTPNGGKQVCASPPVDFNRARATQKFAAPRLVPVLTGATAFQLHSRPGATKVIYLDFDGGVTQNTPWNGPTITTTAYDMDGSPSTFSTQELANITEIWQRVAEHYSPFDVDVTTQAPAATADLINTGGSDTKWGIRVLFGSSNPSPAPGSGGVAYVGGFGWNVGTGADVPCFVLQDGVGTFPKYNADAAAHEAGHTLGLSHDGQFPSNASNHVEYYEGQGSGKVAWAPVMGVGYYVPFVQWSKGEYANASNTEDDLAIISTENGFGYRPDDFASSQASAGAIPGTVGTNSFSVNVSGIVENRNDSDWFKIVAGAGSIVLNAVGGPANSMLDIQLSLYDSNGQLIVAANPPDDIIASINQSVAAGTYYVKIEGVGLGDPLTTGYTDYSSIGQFTITGSYVTGGSSSSGSAPVLSGANNQFYGVKQGPKNINVGIIVSDADSPTLASGSVTITNVVSGEDVLAANLQSATTGNIAGSYNASTGTYTLTSAGATATVAQWQAALRTVTYSNTNSNPSLTPRNFQFQVSDGTNSSNLLKGVINIGYFYVTATYDSNSKTLTLGDDTGDNSVTITLSGSQLKVQGNGPTLIGSKASSAPSVTFPFNTDVKIVANFLAGGSDTIALSGVKSSNAAFTMGNGNDTVTFNLCNITKLTVDGGNGIDTVTVTATFVGSRTYTSVP